LGRRKDGRERGTIGKEMKIFGNQFPKRGNGIFLFPENFELSPGSKCISGFVGRQRSGNMTHTFSSLLKFGGKKTRGELKRIFPPLSRF
jgi:hypothetical protein